MKKVHKARILSPAKCGKLSPETVRRIIGEIKKETGKKETKK